MTFANMTNIVMIILCLAVLVQCARMMRSLDAFRRADLAGTAAALDGATGEARRVLGEIRQLLASEAGPKIRAIEEARAAADELSVMIGIANASADRLLDSGKAAAAPAPRARRRAKAAA